ncbi:unnamed protein product [Acanthoscelides obtectus]|uniref:Uncharacterized protein n=1 Tax=Acanthoscelides obtectus TaxID=200917 RepID=A0A9P0JMY4_ACAOB|nr:unnamed protein product [Acanthoscelides obtectus]CAK1661072.1 hypothetical protein AOBTE_LOCUS22419 [Acanthoscelides obtectus]
MSLENEELRNPQQIVDAFAKHFQSTYIQLSTDCFSTGNVSRLPVTTVEVQHVRNAMKRQINIASSEDAVIRILQYQIQEHHTLYNAIMDSSETENHRLKPRSMSVNETFLDTVLAEKCELRLSPIKYFFPGRFFTAGMTVLSTQSEKEIASNQPDGLLLNLTSFGPPTVQDKRLQAQHDIALRAVVDAPSYVPNGVLYDELRQVPVVIQMRERARKFFEKNERHGNQLIKDALDYDPRTVPQTENDWIAIAKGFEKRWNFPHCLGSLNRRDIDIIPPANSGSFFSITNIDTV